MSFHGLNSRSDAPPRAFIKARLLDPSRDLDTIGGLIVENGVIAACGPQVTADSLSGDMSVRDCTDAMLIPGLVDMRVFTGEPGAEHRETLASASKAAASGGVTTAIVMPNTRPVIDDVALVDFILRRARDTAIIRIAPMAALTRNAQGLEMTEIGLLREAGAVALTDGVRSVANPQLLRRALCYARDFAMPVAQHLEVPELACGGVMNEGEVATRLGLTGIPQEAEIIMLERDLRLVAMTGAPYHAAQISCRASLDLIARAKADGLPVSCGVSINHLTLNENDIGAYRSFFKLSPPLRCEDDRQAMVEGLAQGLIDAIVSAHDPQDPETKRLPFDEAAFGAIGLETLLSAALSLYHSRAVALQRIIAALSARPAGILGLDAGTLRPGAPGDVALIDLHRPWRVTESGLHSKSKNSPFEQRGFEGRVLETIVAGETVFTLDPENGE
ncbi:MAG: dihydroorotase [Hyphomicrobiales bacterium]